MLSTFECLNVFTRTQTSSVVPNVLFDGCSRELLLQNSLNEVCTFTSAAMLSF